MKFTTLSLVTLSASLALGNPVESKTSDQLSKRSGWYKPGCDWKGPDDFKNVRSLASQCGTTCQSTPGCNHYTWSYWPNVNNQDGTGSGTCWLKSGSDDVFVTVSDQNTICGAP